MEKQLDSSTIKYEIFLKQKIIKNTNTWIVDLVSDWPSFMYLSAMQHTIICCIPVENVSWMLLSGGAKLEPRSGLEGDGSLF